MRSLTSRPLAAGLASFAVAATLAGLWAGCSTAAKEDDGGFDAGIGTDASGDTQVQVIDVRDDAGSTAALCGDEQLCDPDIAALCTSLGAEAGAEAASDGASTEGACRIIKRNNRSIAACAPSGKVSESEFCSSDDECAPGLTCVGALGRCLRFCCKEWTATTTTPDAGGGTHYCTPRPLTARPSEKVPVWVKLDNCTLLDDALQCLEGTTCTVVTNDGRTTCVPAGTGIDYDSCAEEPCNRGYACLGTSERLCRKLCKIADATGCPSGAYCQRLPTIPDGYGICTGGG